MTTNAETKRRWREENPDKIAAQAARRKAREAAMSEAEREALRAKRREKLKQYRLSIKDDVEKRKKIREDARRNYRLRHGLPPDAPTKTYRTFATEEERKEARLAQKRASYAKRRGLTLEQVAAYNAERNAVIAANKQRRAEDAAKRAQKKAEARAAAERAKRRAAPAKISRDECNSAELHPAKPINNNDPPELIALFRKASKGQPPIPYNPKGRKLSVFHFRGAR